MAKTISDGLRADLALALSKTDLGKTFRDSIEPGKASGSALVRLSWDLTVGGDYDQKINHTIPWERLFATALGKLNGTTVEALVREALSGDGAPAEVKEEAQAAVAAIKGAQPPRRARGKVTGVVTATEVTGWSSWSSV